MYKKSASIFTIVFKSFKAFFDRLPQFLWFMLYPAFGPLIGVLIIFAPFLMASGPESVYLAGLLVTVPVGLGIFFHSFWRYCLASGALVLIAKQIIENETLKDFNYYLDGFKKRSGEYIAFLLIIGFLIPFLFMILTGIIIFALIAIGYLDIKISMQSVAMIGVIIGLLMWLVMIIFYSVPLQSFVLNPNLTPTESILRAAKYTIRNYFPTIGLLILIILITGIYGVLVDFILSHLVFTPAFYQEHAAFKDIVDLVSLVISASFGAILLPFTTVASTWWYLRMEKEHNSRVKQRGQ